MAQSADHKNFVSVQHTDAQDSSSRDSPCESQTPCECGDSPVRDKIDFATETDGAASLKARGKKISRSSSPDGEENKTYVNCDACGDKTKSYPQIGKSLCDMCQRFFRLSRPRISKPTTTTNTNTATAAGRTED